MNQNELILSYLKAHKTITQGVASKFGCARLASRIHELRAKGHSISQDMITVKTVAGESRIAEYRYG